ncbi:unnamed protein product [Chironomus riparius]|uniref:Ionotropic receptor n=1 Tax=Chironomus riparius TaxID=315576 RepID=A0A9P0NBY8_9DIPT|nr:unnamed protein product [Chironomus riparius]
MTHYLEALSKARNSTFKKIFITDHTLIEEIWLSRKMDLTLNNGYVIDSLEPKLLTYEEDAFCVLVPLPPKSSLFQLIFIEPFDGWTWLCLFLTISSSFTVWWMFRGRGAVDSPLVLGYGMFVMFLGQGVEYSRRNRLVLVILLQLIISMIFVLSNAYQGVITSFMIDPIRDETLKTFDEVLATKYKFLMNQLFAALINDTEEFKIDSSRKIVRFNNATDTFSSRILERKYVIITKCDHAEFYISNKLLDGIMLLDYYYLLPTRLLSSFVRLEASHFNPFLQMFQNTMDLCFEAGLPYIWKVFEFQNVVSYYKSTFNDEPVYLELKDLTQVFSILVIGYVFSTLTLLAENLFHRHLKRIKLAYFARNLKVKAYHISHCRRKLPKDVKYQMGALYYIIHRHQKLKRLKPKRMKIREIFVRSKRPEE